MHSITFRPLTTADFPQLLTWLQRPHVAEWWPGDHSAATVADEFSEMLDAESTTRASIIVLDGRDIGYIQSYVAMGSGAGWWEDVHDPGVCGIDQFIGEPDLLNRGIGAMMIRAFVERLFAAPEVTLVQTDPDPTNARAVRCYEKAGFHRVGTIQTPDGAALLMTQARSV